MAVFVSNANRDAYAAIAGFVYQVDRTVLRWLELRPDEILQLERGEDLDLVQVETGELSDPRILEQIKRRSSPLSLKSADALAAVARFCEHRKLNPTARLRFRFITTGTIAKEKAWKLPGTAIESWQSINRGDLDDPEQATALEAIRTFLQGCERPADLQQSTWAPLEEIVSEENRGQLLDVIQSFEWSLGVIDQPKLEDEIKQGLVQLKHATDTDSAKALFDRLFLYVLRRLITKGPKALTPTELVTQMSFAPLSDLDQAILALVRDLRGLPQRVEALEAQSRQLLDALASQTDSMGERVQADIRFSLPSATLDPPELIEPAIPRAKTVDEILGELKARTWVNLVGEPGTGKTQLCALTLKRANADVLWINLRGYNPSEACNVIDAGIETATGTRFHPLLRGWYLDAVSHLGAGKLIILDDVPRILPGGALSSRLDALQAACKHHALRLLTTTYYKLPEVLAEALLIKEMESPMFSAEEILEFLAVHGAPETFTTEKFAGFLETLTRGLPVLVSAAARLLKSASWQMKWEAIQSFFTGDYARAIKHDARAMIESTVPEDDARQLLYRLTCIIGPISKKQVETISRVPKEINLGLEKLDRLVGLWVQPYTKDTYRLSPLVELSLSSLLDSRTRRGVHALLGAIVLRRKTLTPMDVVTCVFHFQQAELPDQAAVVLMQALLKLTELDYEVPDESLVSAIWNNGPLPDALNINLRLSLRALQIAFADKRGQEFSVLLDDLERLIREANELPEAQVGIFMAVGLLAMRFARKHPSVANRFLITTLRTAPKAVLPDGSRPPSPPGMTLESLLWATASATDSDEDVFDWLETLKKLTPEELTNLAQSDLAADNSVIVCDLVWLREYRKPASEQNWQLRDATLQRIEDTASQTALALLRAAATRTRVTVLAESLGNLDAAISLANDRLPHTSSEEEGFLIREVVGRQLAYASRWEEALQWIDQALNAETKEYAVFRRNLLVTKAEVVALKDPISAAEYTSQAVKFSESAQLLPLRVAESLGEHSIALWKAGQPLHSFVAWQAAVESLAKGRDQKPDSTKLFLAFSHAAGYFSGVSLLGKPPNPEYVIPNIGWFLSWDNMSIDRYQPIQEGLLLLRTAMFAEGVGETSAASRWAKKAFKEIRPQSGADLMRSFAWLPIPESILTGNYREAIQQAQAIAQLPVPDAASFDAFNVPVQEKTEIQELHQKRRMMERALLFALVPTVFRLQTIRFDRNIRPEADAVVSLLREAAEGTESDWNWAANLLELTLSGERGWKELHADGSRYYSEGRAAFGVLSFLGSLLAAPLKQSLYSQISLEKDLEGVFAMSPSIRLKLIQPFFIGFWANVTDHGSTDFRTSEAHTSKSYREAAASPPAVRVKKVFSSMVFCLGLSLPQDLKNWIETS
jgi:tetratricopeptide (TPR) repeat protein